MGRSTAARLVIPILMVGLLGVLLNSNPVAGESSSTESSLAGGIVALTSVSHVLPRNAEFNVDMELQQGINVAAFEGQATFNSSLVSLIDVIHTGFLTSTGRGQIDALKLGPLELNDGVFAVGGATCPFPDCDDTQPRQDTGVDAPGTLQTLRFKATGAGAASIGLQEVLLVSPDGSSIEPITTQSLDMTFTIPAFDVDADGKTDIGIFRPGTRFWYILQSTQSYDVFQPFILQWGDAGDIPVVADFDGDGTTDLGVYRPSNGFWYIVLSSTSYDPGNPLVRSWGESSDKPVVGDFDGDSQVDFGVYRPSNRFFYLLLSSKNYDIFQPLVKSWGDPGDIPVIGDFDGDGQTDFGVYRPSTRFWYLLLSSRNYDIFDPLIKQWGDSTDTPVVGDFDGDGQADFGVFRPSNTFWYLLLSTRSYDIYDPLLRPWGEAGDLPVVGDLDSDGDGDFGVFRPSLHRWFFLLSSTGYDIFNPFIANWGESGDVTIPFAQPTSSQLTQ